MPRERLVVFISSPGDVRPERAAAERIVARLARQFATHFEITSIRWERNPLRATADFQSQIPRASAADIVVVILWSRLGSLLDENQYRGLISGQPVTGTEYEFEDALNGRDGIQPALFVYRKTGIPQFTDERQILEYPDQSARVKRFFETWIKRVAHHTFSDIVAFEELLSDHLLGEIRRRIQAPHPETVVSWFQGSPFKGLETFDKDDGPIFFGRARAQTELEQLLIRRAGSGRPWVIVLGPSGSGKSSLVKAGLLPDITTPGYIQDVGSCRYAVMRPGETGGDLIAGLAAALMHRTAFPELTDLQYTPPALSGILHDAPASAATPLKQGLAAARAKDKVLNDAEVRLAIVLDQLEELFSLPFKPSAINEFIEVLDAFAATHAVWIVAALRTDFLQDLERSATLAARFDSGARYLLAAPNEAELAQIIERPAEAAGLTFAIDDASGVGLGEVLRMAARSSPAALPLLEYVLEQLWHQRTEAGVLTWEAYRKLGELEGAIGLRAEQVYADLPDPAQQSLPKVLRALVTVAPGEKSVPTARYTPLDLFPSGTPSRTLIDAFADSKARLLVKEGDPEPKVRVAHEALLRNWPRAKHYLDADAKDLQLRDRLEQQADLWTAAHDVSRLLPPGLPLSEAQDLLSRRGDELNAATVKFINASTAAYQDELDQERRRRIEAEWREAQAELAQLRATAEEYFARAIATSRRKGTIGRDTWETRSAALSAEANRLLGSAYDLHRRLRNHPGAPPKLSAIGHIFSLEAVGSDGECLLIHYGDAAAPRLILIDGGPKGNFRNALLPRLEVLRNHRAEAGTLSIDLVIVSHYDADRVEGIFDFLRYLASEGAGRYRIERLWYNNFHAIFPPEERKSYSFKEELRKLADFLSIPINVPFEYFVMPSAAGPTRFTLPGGLEITITGPPFDSVRTWYLSWMKGQRKGAVPQAFTKTFGSPKQELASGVELRLIRTPPGSFNPAFDGPQPDMSVANLSSIVAYLRFSNRSMLLTGDARSDQIQRGLFDAWLLDPEAGMDVDLLKLPHFGSTHSCSKGFLDRVRAEHYVVTENRKFRLPGPEIFEAISSARGSSPHTIHARKTLVVNLLTLLPD